MFPNENLNFEEEEEEVEENKIIFIENIETNSFIDNKNDYTEITDFYGDSDKIAEQIETLIEKTKHQDNNLFDIINECCSYLLKTKALIENNKHQDNNLLIVLIRKLTTFIMVNLRDNNSFRKENSQDNKHQNIKEFIKSTLLEFMKHDDEVIHNTAAISYLLISSIDIQANKEPFFSNILKIINDKKNDEVKEEEELQIKPIISSILCLFEYAFEKEILTPTNKYFEQAINGIWELVHQLLSPSFFNKNIINDDDDDHDNETKKKKILLYQIRKKCFTLLKAAMPFLFKLMNMPNMCSELVHILIEADNIDQSRFISEIYDVLILLYANYYSKAKICINEVFKFSINDLDGNIIIRKISSLEFWINMSKIESSMLRMNQRNELHYFTLGAYEPIIKRIFIILKQINSNNSDEDLEETALECVSCFSRCEPRETIRSNLYSLLQKWLSNEENNDDLSHNAALKILSKSIKIFHYDEIKTFIGLIFKCAQNENYNENLTITSLHVIAKIIKYFPDSLELSDDIVEICNNKLRYAKSYNNLSELILDIKNSSITVKNANIGLEEFINIGYEKLHNIKIEDPNSTEIKRSNNIEDKKPNSIEINELNSIQRLNRLFDDIKRIANQIYPQDTAKLFNDITELFQDIILLITDKVKVKDKDNYNKKLQMLEKLENLILFINKLEIECELKTPEYTETYKIFSFLIKSFSKLKISSESKHIIETFGKIKQCIQDDYLNNNNNISIALPAIISLIESDLDNLFIIEIFEDLMNKLQKFYKEEIIEYIQNLKEENSDEMLEYIQNLRGHENEDSLSDLSDQISALEPIEFKSSNESAIEKIEENLSKLQDAVEKSKIKYHKIEEFRDNISGIRKFLENKQSKKQEDDENEQNISAEENEEISNIIESKIDEIQELIHKLQKCFEDEQQKSHESFEIDDIVCRIFKSCFDNFRDKRIDIKKYIKPLLIIIVNNFGRDIDEDLLDLATSMIPEIFESGEPKFIDSVLLYWNDVMEIVKVLFFETDSPQRIPPAAEFMSDLVISNPKVIDYEFLKEYKLFDIYISILNNEATLKSNIGPIISSISDIIESLDIQDFMNDNPGESDQKKNKFGNKYLDEFIEITKKMIYKKVDLSKSKNDIENTNDIFEALCRFYAVITNFTDHETDFSFSNSAFVNVDPEVVVGISKDVFKLFKQIHLLELDKVNKTISQFVFCIVNNLYALKGGRNEISFLTNDESIKEMLNGALYIDDQSEEFKQRAKILYSDLYYESIE